MEKKGADENIGFIQLNRPSALNALCDGLMTELRDVIAQMDADAQIGCIVLTGVGKAFAGQWLFNCQRAKCYLTCTNKDVHNNYCVNTVVTKF